MELEDGDQRLEHPVRQRRDGVVVQLYDVEPRRAGEESGGQRRERVVADVQRRERRLALEEVRRQCGQRVVLEVDTLERVEPVEQSRGQGAERPVAGDPQVAESVQPREIPRRQRDQRGVLQPDGRDFRELRRRHVVAAIHRGVVDALDDLRDHRPAAPADAAGGQRRRAVHLVGRAKGSARGRCLHRRAGGIGDRAADVDRVEKRPERPIWNPLASRSAACTV